MFEVYIYLNCPTCLQEADTHWDIGKEWERYREGQRDEEIENTERQRARETERHRDRETERQRDRETDRQRDRETERQSRDQVSDIDREIRKVKHLVYIGKPLKKHHIFPSSTTSMLFCSRAS